MAVVLADVRAKRRDVLRILRAHGAEPPRVFGSVARGTADERSDVDLLVDIREPRPRGFRYVGLITDLEEELARLLGAPVHVTEIRSSTLPVTRHILEDAVSL